MLLPRAGYTVPVFVTGNKGGETFLSPEEARNLGISEEAIAAAIESGIPIPVDPQGDQPHPEKSTILCQIIEGDSYLFQEWNSEKKCLENLGLDFHEFQYEGGSAEIENEAGVLQDTIAGLLDPEFHRVGWFVVEGFYGHYWKDYYGECDVEYECDDIRVARWSDIEAMGLMKAPWYIRALRMFGIDPEVPPRLMYPVPREPAPTPTPRATIVAQTPLRHHPKCPRCKGQGFYLRHHGQGYYRDGSFGHNQWEDCTCDPYMDEADLPAAVKPTGDSW